MSSSFLSRLFGCWSGILGPLAKTSSPQASATGEIEYDSQQPERSTATSTLEKANSQTKSIPPKVKTDWGGSWEPGYEDQEENGVSLDDKEDDVDQVGSFGGPVPSLLPSSNHSDRSIVKSEVVINEPASGLALQKPINFAVASTPALSESKQTEEGRPLSSQSKTDMVKPFPSEEEDPFADMTPVFKPAVKIVVDPASLASNLAAKRANPNDTSLASQNSAAAASEDPFPSVASSSSSRLFLKV